MSAAWGSAGESIAQEEARAKQFIRMWGMLAVAGLFLIFVSMRLHINLF
jgi:hypothetical protein